MPDLARDTRYRLKKGSASEWKIIDQTDTELKIECVMSVSGMFNREQRVLPKAEFAKYWEEVAEKDGAE